MRKVFVAPSLLSADKNHVFDEIAKVEKSGAQFIHIDIMDGVFVPNTSFSFEFASDVIAHSLTLTNDVHIMVADPLKVGVAYAKAGAGIVTFHYEACSSDGERHRVIAAIRKAGAKVGMSIKPATAPSVLLPFLSDLDLVLVMSVEPGKGGQAFLDESLDKIKSLRNYIDKGKHPCLIEVDGGINETTGKLAVEAGVDVLVAGSYLFGHEDFAIRVKGLLAL